MVQVSRLFRFSVKPGIMLLRASAFLFLAEISPGWHLFIVQTNISRHRLVQIDSPDRIGLKCLCDTTVKGIPLPRKSVAQQDTRRL